MGACAELKWRLCLLWRLCRSSSSTASSSSPIQRIAHVINSLTHTYIFIENAFSAFWQIVVRKFLARYKRLKWAGLIQLLAIRTENRSNLDSWATEVGFIFKISPVGSERAVERFSSSRDGLNLIILVQPLEFNSEKYIIWDSIPNHPLEEGNVCKFGKDEAMRAVLKNSKSNFPKGNRKAKNKKIKTH